MKLHEIHDSWEKDSKIDFSQPHYDASKIQELHHKYGKLLSTERVYLHSLEKKLPVLRVELERFLVDQENEVNPDVIKTDYLKAKNKILGKNEIEQRIERDQKMISLRDQIFLSKEKIKVLDDIMKAITQRSHTIKLVIDFILKE